MAVYRKRLLDKDGNTIIPAVGDIYGTVYTATLSSATAGSRADYEFTPDTPIENNKVYAVMFPEPTVNNATIILGDGVSSGSILVPPVSATDSPNYELLTTDMINSTEPLLLMYNGVQWVCLNQKKKVATADLEDSAVTSNKIDFTTFAKYGQIPGVSSFTPSKAWVAARYGSQVTVSGLDPARKYVIFATTSFTEGKGEFRLYADGATSLISAPYNSTGALVGLSTTLWLKPDSSGKIKLQRGFSGEKFGTRWGSTDFTIVAIE